MSRIDDSLELYSLLMLFERVSVFVRYNNRRNTARKCERAATLFVGLDSGVLFAFDAADASVTTPFVFWVLSLCG